ncbi:2-C-methyl-D-erythritol 2,4-cyclodiphosphate synthase [Sodalis sp. CWE]|uniref:2-C-methyl-D-erythritol 2,4-cyclodiphosphate synthase n=1 Tax=Sodalis sp. CWE TaxID=2803816 RepID=UPI001C7CA84D|nr:2-C-methyl-D-erythritol 2,4-cyclodiphosphate synthase [Sodalis sp. CWE]MBX4180986.1 2-C-methyl-D-erythritol 2,4-cyclodiphosphate synthase [Sodalis sp. CWE]
MRIGHGFDIHKFGGIKPLIIGGVCIPYSQGLLAHSDGDVMLHAIIDALLGASALGDIGKLFPDSDPTLIGIESRILLREVWQNRIKNYHCLGNLDVTLIAQLPIITSYISNMRTNISEDLNSHIDSINIKATTTEQLGFIGRNEAIACEAVVLIF